MPWENGGNFGINTETFFIRLSFRNFLGSAYSKIVCNVASFKNFIHYSLPLILEMENLKEILLATLILMLYFQKSLIFNISEFNVKMVFITLPMFACAPVLYYKGDLRVKSKIILKSQLNCVFFLLAPPKLIKLVR